MLLLDGISVGGQSTRAEFLNVTVSQCCDRTKFSWLCAKYWDLYAQSKNWCILITLTVFKASALWADAFYKSKCPSVRLSVCPTVRLCVCSLLRYRLTVFLPPLPEVGFPICLEIRNPWGKVMERSGPPSYGIGATIRIGREMLCLPYAGFFALYL